MILLIDNYDSFTFNIFDYLSRLGQETLVIKNDELTIEEITKLPITKIILSPGPGNPDNAGISLAVVAQLSNLYPILGICLGHQVIAQHFGYSVIKAPMPMHGKTDLIYHNEQGLFKNIKNPLSVVRYHSLIVTDEMLTNSPMTVSARNKQGLIMGLQHRTLPIESVQFHPEAIKTEHGIDLIANFVNNEG